MKAILLDGSQNNDVMAELIYSGLSHELQSRGWQVERIRLCEQKIGNCAGDFFCWIRNPGVCNVNDDNRSIAETVVGSDLMIYLSPVTFGGYSSTLKRMVDHQIQNILPYFAQVEGETHHQKRYDRYPDFLTVGWLPQADPQAEAVFRQLTQRNSINFYAQKSASVVIFASQTESEILAALQSGLNDLQNGQKQAGKSQPKEMPAFDQPGVFLPIQRALLLVGSPRTRKSTSQSLGGYVLEELQARSIQVETIYLHTVMRSSDKLSAMLEAVDAADLLLLAFPLYVDSLPAPVIEALERIAAHRQASVNPHPVLFAALANSGFPEAAHNATALAICQVFARQAGFGWAGSMALGAGEGLVHGGHLRELSGPAVPIKKALDLAAQALARGEAIPAAAVTLLARPIIPGWLYRFLGGMGWVQQAKKYGVEKLLRRKTYS